ncbi:MAG: hypothetical protein JWN63_2014 [Candidatus Acidoferrum typicum]|jgi:hypothetical protein|nr:hypothetical protein [Candidatus Acidoferrum typicum]
MPSGGIVMRSGVRALLRPSWSGRLRMRRLGDEIIPFPKFFPSVPDLCKIFHEYQRAASQLFWNE